MRKILLLPGLCLICTAVFLGLQQHLDGRSLAMATNADSLQPIPDGPATRQLEQTLVAQDDAAASAPAVATAVAPRISLAPRNRPKGARFIKPPAAD